MHDYVQRRDGHVDPTRPQNIVIEYRYIVHTTLNLNNVMLFTKYAHIGKSFKELFNILRLLDRVVNYYTVLTTVLIFT